MILGKQPVDGVYWTLQYEIIFYIIVSLLLSSRHRISDIIVLAWLIITFVFFCFQDSLPIYLAKAIRVFLIPNYASTFIIGLQTGICVLRKNISLYSIVIILLSFVSLSFWQPSKVVVFFSLSYVLLLNVVSSNKSKLNKKTRYTSWLAFIASISYPLYLIHQKIGFIIISKIIEYTGCVSEIIIIVPIAISIVIAYLIHKFIETRNITILK
jgi:peptidoglycan/LPS O-acetylase OafA/YrhL